MTGKLYGIGVGPGDPELLTLKAVRVIRECDVIAVPGKQKGKTTAYKIVQQAVPEIAEKECLEVDMPMTKDRDVLKQSHTLAFEKTAQALEHGKNVAFLTLGDPCVYSTYLYVHKKILAAGYETEIINGIPSFCAVSARLNQGLVEKSQMLHVIPSSYGMEQALELPGTKVLMKAGRSMGMVKKSLKKTGAKAVMVENCGMESESVYDSVEAIPDEAGYYSLIIVKE